MTAAIAAVLAEKFATEAKVMKTKSAEGSATGAQTEEHTQLLARQVADWRKKVARVQDLIAHVTGHTAQLSPAELDKLEALARAATPGPWKAIEWTCHAPTTVRAGAVGITVADTTGHGRHSDACAIDAAFIAAANPAAILALIALARAGQPAGQQAGDAAQFFADANKIRIAELEELNQCLKMKAGQFADEAFKAQQQIVDLRAQLASAQRDAEHSGAGLTQADIKTLRFAADALEGLDYEDTAGDLRTIAARAQLTNTTGEGLT